MAFQPGDMNQTFSVRKLTEADVPTIFRLYCGYPLYFSHLQSEPTEQSVRDDLAALPPGKTARDKFFLGFFCGAELVAVTDLILGYPDSETAFIGLFMTEHRLQRKGIGTEIIREAEAYLKKQGFRQIRLGRVKGNPQSEAFWRKNGFSPTGVETRTEHYTIVVLQKEL